MKLKSLILGSVAAAGLSTAGYAADLGVLTSLDVCDSLGISGLTLSSTDHCLAITGNVSYEFQWGDYDGKYNVADTYVDRNATPRGRGSIAPGTTAAVPTQLGVFALPDGTLSGTGANPTPLAGESRSDYETRVRGLGLIGANDVVREVSAPLGSGPAAGRDWGSKVETWVQFVGSSSTDFGRAAATIKMKSVSHTTVTNLGAVAVGGDATNGGATNGNGIWIIDEAFVQVGDTTTIMAGKKSSIANFGDDEPLNFLGLFNSQAVDTGVMYAKDSPKTGGHVIQVVSQVADGLTVKVGLENLDGAATGTRPFGGFYNVYNGTQAAGTLVGVVEYAGNGIKAHATGVAGGILDGVVENWAGHVGAQGAFDMFTVVAAGAFGGNVAGDNYWNVLGSASANFDIFKIAISGEASGGYDSATATTQPTAVGAGGSIGASVTEGVSINLGARWFDSNNAAPNTEGYQAAAQLVAAITETISLTGEVGVYGTNLSGANTNNFYASALAEWKPGGGFTSSLKGEAYQNGAYKVTFKAAKEFK